MKKIIFIRHGKTKEGEKNILLGHSQGVLSVNGKKEALEWGEKLKNESIEKIFSSDLTRAIDTAQIIGGFLNVDQIEQSVLIRERSAGIYDGKSEDLINWEEYEKQPHEDRKHKKGESFSDVEKRIIPFLELLKKEDANIILVVCHSVVLYVILKYLKNISLSDVLNIDIKNKSLEWILEDGVLKVV